MGPEQITKVAIGGVILLVTLVALGYVSKDQWAYLTPFGVIGTFFLLSGLLS